ncbi:MAG: hypothetical protein WCP45_17945 [Verrucomicrobiota bacterium]
MTDWFGALPNSTNGIESERSAWLAQIGAYLQGVADAAKYEFWLSQVFVGFLKYLF